MDDIEPSNISSVITNVLPDLPTSILNIVLETLQSLGVGTTEDLQYIQEADLLTVLRPIQARKLLAAWKQSTETTEFHSQSTFTSPVSSACSSVSLSSSSTPSPSPSPSPRHLIATADWFDSFQIPWEKLPEALMQCLERGKRPSSKLCRELIRIVVSEMMHACASPGKQASTEVAKKMVEKYPRSLQDVIEGDVVGTGYHSLVKQLQARIENVKRSSVPRILKRRRGSDEFDTDEITAEQRAAVQDTYGCINWDMEFMPVSETLERQQEKKDKMKVLSEQATFSTEEVKPLMKCTYFSQRKAVNSGTDLQSLMEEWPFLFKEIGMAVHFHELTGVSLKETFLGNVEKKGKRVLDFMKIVCADKSKQVLQAVTKLKILRGQLEGCSEDVKDLVLLILSYFNEKEEKLFCYVEETCMGKEVQVENLPVTPCIIVRGTSCYAAKQFMLSVDQKIVNDHIPTFISAVCMMFASYYCFNIHYPVDLGSTLEFIQRCFFNISPEKGTKVETKKNKKQLPVNPRVLTLIADLSDHEWRETC
ncbi:Interferon-induced 44 [Labeo rohita]|uniref:Interferon-induced 44 n=1 Tax=Labeo rohita TaxID=84645 RepID=A0A498NRK7_LABRO|nr:Interferon-induced 44 [Labeo rohita]